jgi:hypothetical protein
MSEKDKGYILTWSEMVWGCQKNEGVSIIETKIAEVKCGLIAGFLGNSE